MENPKGVGHDLEKAEISWLPGERYDAFSGTMNLSITDLSLPGNGKLPIEIKRTFHQAPDFPTDEWSYDRSFGRMDLAIPKVVVLHSDGKYDGCKGLNTNLREEVDRSNENQVRNVRGPLVFNDGDKEETFYSVNAQNLTLAQSAVPHAIDYISENNWAISCLDPVPRNNTNIIKTESKLIVHSPDGIQYEMSPLPQNPLSRFQVNSWGQSIYWVTKVTDPYGNWLRYDYGWFPALGPRYPSRDVSMTNKLTSITANDGRKVSLSYAENGRRHETIYNGTYLPRSTHWRVVSIKSNGLPKPRELKYTYTGINGHPSLVVTENERSVRTYEFLTKFLMAMTTPEGGRISYKYKDWDPDNIGAVTKDVTYGMLETRTIEQTGKTFRFEHHPVNENEFARIIRKSTGAIEYRFKKSSYSHYRFRGWPIMPPYSVDSGKLIRQKVFDNPNIGWAENQTRSLLLDRTYTYKELYKISSLGMQDAARIVPDKESTVLYSDRDNSNKAVFTKEYFSHDFRGYPTGIVETTSGSNLSGVSSRKSWIIYQHSNFDRWIVGKPVAENIDNLDYTNTKYSAKGDIQWIKRNGIKTQENSWYTTGASKGELYAVISGGVGITKYSDYFRGQARTITDPVGRVSKVQVNSDATIGSETRPGDNQLTEYRYDSLRRLSGVDPARQESRTRTYSWHTNNRQRNDFPTAVLRLDEYGRSLLRTIYVGLNKWSTVEYEYDSEGRVTFESHPQPLSASQALNDTARYGRFYTYDGLGRVTRVTQSGRAADTITTRYFYDISANGNLKISQTDGRGLKTSTEYLSFGEPHYNWPISVSEADGSQSKIVRDSVGKVHSHTRNSVSTYYQYNAQKLVSQIERSDDGITRLTYDDYGKLINRSNNGRSVTYSYYHDSKIKHEEYNDISGGQVANIYQYDRNGNLGVMMSGSSDGSQNNRITYKYNQDNNVVQETLEIDNLTYNMYYNYDQWSNLESIQFPNNNKYRFSPNLLGDPTAMKQEGASQKVMYKQIEYNADRSVSLLRRDGHQIEMSIDAGQRPMTYKMTEYGNGRYGLLASKDYFYDGANNVSRINDSANERYNTFEYDSRNRLTRKSGGNTDPWSFSYSTSDDIGSIRHGNKLTSFQYDNNTKRLRKVVQNGVDRNFQYDSHGNIVNHERLTASGSRLGMRLDFNAANKLVSTSDGTKYSYDARGLRVKKDKNGAIYSFYDRDKRLIYRDDKGAGVTSEYFYVDNKLVARRDTDRSSKNKAVGTINSPFDSIVASLPATPSTVSPSGVASGTAPVLTWKAVPDAKQYYIDVRSSIDDAVLVYKKYSASQAGCSADTGNCTIDRPDSTKLGSSRWRVRSENSNGTSGWSNWEK